MSTNRAQQAEDHALLRRAQLGDAEAFDALVERHTPRLYRSVRRLASDQGEAEALVQEAWLRAWKALPDCDPDQPFFPWLVTIALNYARDLWRKKMPTAFADIGQRTERWAAEGPNPESALEVEQMLERLYLGLERLSESQRTAIVLRYGAELSYEDMAQVMNVPINTIRTYLHRAKARLRRWMGVEDDRSNR